MDAKAKLENQLTAALSKLKEAEKRYKNLEKSHLKSEKDTNLKNAISEIFIKTSDDQLYSELLKLFLDIFKSQFGTLGYFNEEGSFVTPSLTREIFWKNCNIPEKEIIFEKGTFKGIWKKAIDTQSILFSNSGPFITPKGHISIENTLVAPIIFRKKVISALHLANKSDGYKKQDVERAEILTNYLAPILYARIEKDKHEKENFLSNLAFKESEEKLRLFLQSSTEGFAILDSELNFIECNDQGAKILGLKRLDLIGKNAEDISPDIKKSGRYDRYNEVIRTGKPFIFENLIPHPSLGEIHLNLTAFKVGFGLGLIITDITERKSAEAAIRESESWSRLITENVPILIGYVDKNMCYQFVNKMYEQWFGEKKESIIGKKVKDILDEKAFERSLPFIKKALKGKSSKFVGQVKLPNGELKYFHNHLVSNFLKDGTNDGYYVVVTDITEMKKSEEKIKASLREKEVLLQEVHHRVKNNLQVISSLLKLQANFSQDERIEDILKMSQNRIKSMALVHEKLYRSADLAKINLKKYIEALVNDLFCSFEPYSGKIKIHVQAQDIELKVEQAPHLGLIINELVSNSLKHAFPDRKDGQIDISLNAHKKGKIELVVSDNGVGLPEEFDKLKTKSLGLHLVSLLVYDQLHGSIRVNSKAGTKYQIEIKE